MSRYILIDEESKPENGCEWDLWTFGTTCIRTCTKAVVDTKYISTPTEYPEGDHVGHYCVMHGEPSLILYEGYKIIVVIASPIQAAINDLGYISGRLKKYEDKND
jgi:hypothetical protein